MATTPIIHPKIKEEIIAAMRAKDADKLDVLRALNTAFANDLIARGSADTFIDDENALTLIRRSVKQHKDSIDQFTKGNRTDLVGKEQAELAVLESFLPQMMSKEEVLKIATAKKAELGMTDKTKIGQFTGILMKDLKGKADGAVVKEVVESLFQ